MSTIAKISLEQRVRAIASVSPFMGWPPAAIERLARAARVAAYAQNSTVLADGKRLDTLILVLHGTVQTSVTAPSGRRVTFAVVSAGTLYGIAPLIDDLPMRHEVIAVTPVAALAIPHWAVRKELAAEPGLWASIAHDAAGRSRVVLGELRRFVFDDPRQRMAAVLIGLAQGSAKVGDGPVHIPVRLPQERLAEMLGVSRQWATTLVREMTQAGLVEWRYGRVTVLDQPGLHAIAEQSINNART